MNKKKEPDWVKHIEEMTDKEKEQTKFALRHIHFGMNFRLVRRRKR